jgi:hypothetical protein
MDTVVDYARGDRLGELVESRQFTRPLSGTEALRRIEEKRHAPGTKPRSPHAALGELRAMKKIWAAEAVEYERQRRRRDPQDCLAEILAKQFPPWWGQ